MILAPLRALRVPLKLATLTTFALLALGATTALADTTYNVNDTGDSGDGTCDATCTLRDAVDNSNSAGGNNTINVPAGTYLLDYELYIGIEGSVTINGAGARSTIIDAQHNDRVLYIDYGTVSMSQLTITNGDYKREGGGIYNNGEKLTLTNVAVVNNRAIDDCKEKAAATQESCYTGGGQGGGIYNDYSSELVVNESEISNNTAAGGEYSGGYGGGIYNSGQMKLTNVTLNGNVAESGFYQEPAEDRVISAIPGFGGGIAQSPYIDAAERGGSELSGSLLNVTIAGNTAGLGGGIATNYFDTADAEGPPQVTLTIKNTIVANNEATEIERPRVTDGTDNCWDPGGLIASNGNNLESDTSCAFTGSGDQQNTDPALGALANNGGPTNTMAIDTGSPALDRANNDGCPGTDQRGVTRPQNGTCDVGAYEKEVAPPAPAAVTAQAKPAASSKASGPKSCVVKSATIRVRGQNISSVRYSLDGKKIATKKGNNTSVKINAKGLSSGVHRVTAKVTYTSATGAKASTKRITFSRCARKAAKPKFTG